MSVIFASPYRDTFSACRLFLLPPGDAGTLAPLSLFGARQPVGSLRSALHHFRAPLLPRAVTPALRRKF